jgi:hypothetical protein
VLHLRIDVMILGTPIRYAILALTLAAALPAAAENLPIIPDPSLTPGAVASTDPSDVCGLVVGLTYSKRHRQTPAELKREIYAAYGMDRAGRDFEIDHRVPLCIGGADARENLWPQEGWEHPSYHDKDRLEAEVCRRVCRNHEISLPDGQAIFLGDWIEGYQKIFGEDPHYR